MQQPPNQSRRRPPEDYSERGQPPRQPYPRYRQEPPPPRLALEDVMDELATLQRTVANLSARQPSKDEVTGLFRELETSFKAQLAHYYTAEMVDAKLAERSQIVQTVQSQITDVQQKLETEKQALREVKALHGGWRLWQIQVVVANSLFVGGILLLELIIAVIKLALGIH